MVPSGAIILHIKVSNIKHLENVYVAAFPVFVCLQKDSQKTMNDEDDVNLTKLFR